MLRGKTVEIGGGSAEQRAVKGVWEMTIKVNFSWFLMEELQMWETPATRFLEREGVGLEVRLAERTCKLQAGQHQRETLDSMDVPSMQHVLLHAQQGNASLPRQC